GQSGRGRRRVSGGVVGEPARADGDDVDDAHGQVRVALDHLAVDRRVRGEGAYVDVEDLPRAGGAADGRNGHLRVSRVRAHRLQSVGGDDRRDLAAAQLFLDPQGQELSVDRSRLRIAV